MLFLEFSILHSYGKNATVNSISMLFISISLCTLGELSVYEEVCREWPYQPYAERMGPENCTDDP